MYKIADEPPLSLGVFRLHRVKMVKYMSLILNWKLSNVEERTRKALVVLCCCKELLESCVVSHQKFFHFYFTKPWLRLSMRMQICGEEDEVETSTHCPALARLMLKHISCHTFYEPAELTRIDMSRLYKLMAGYRRFVDLSRSFRSVLSSSENHNERAHEISAFYLTQSQKLVSNVYLRIL